jgi:hypothetical protein
VRAGAIRHDHAGGAAETVDHQHAVAMDGTAFGLKVLDDAAVVPVNGADSAVARRSGKCRAAQSEQKSDSKQTTHLRGLL